MKHLKSGIIILFLFSIHYISHAQSYNFEKLYGFPNQNLTGSVQFMPGEGVYFLRGSLENSNNNFISKLDETGTEIWSLQIRNGHVSGWSDITLMADGNYLSLVSIRVSTDRQILALVKFSPSGTVLWQRAYSRKGRIIGLQLIKTEGDPFGETYIAKYWKSTGGSSDDMAFTKFDNNANIIWSKDFYIIGDDEAYDFAPTNKGGCIVSGSNSGDAWTSFFYKLDYNGNIVNGTRFYGREYFPRRIIKTRDGGYLSTGRYYDGISQSNAFIMKLDASLKAVWKKSYAVPNTSTGYSSVIEDVNGDYFVSGLEYVSGELKYKITQFDNAGNHLKSVHLGNTSSSSPLNGTTLGYHNDKLIISDIRTPARSGILETLVSVMNTDLESCISVEFSQGTYSDLPLTSTSFSINSSIATYDTDSIQTPFALGLAENIVCAPPSDNCSDFPCGKKGNKVLLCKVPPGNPSNEHEICISPNAVPAHLATGSYCGPCTGMGQRLTAITFESNQGGFVDIDDGMLESGSRLMSETKKAGRLDIMVFPNPSQGEIHVRPNFEGVYALEIIDRTGRVILTGKQKEGETKVDLRHVSPGLYFVRIYTGNDTELEKFLLAR